MSDQDALEQNCTQTRSGDRSVVKYGQSDQAIKPFQAPR